MNIFQQLESTHSKENSLKIIDYIGDDQQKFGELMDCFFMQTKDYRVPQRAAHVVSLTFDKNPDLVLPYLPKLIREFMRKDLKGSLKRNILRILQFCEIQEEDRGKVYDRAFELMTHPQEEIAVRAFAMTVLYNISQFYPDLKPELKTAIFIVLEEPESAPGVRSRGNAILKKLNKEVCK